MEGLRTLQDDAGRHRRPPVVVVQLALTDQFETAALPCGTERDRHVGYNMM